MKKLIIVAMFLLSKAWATNAQQLNSTQSGNEKTASETITGNMNLNTSQNMPEKNEFQLNPNPETVHDKADYLKKSLNNKTASWCLMGGGALLMGIGALTFPKDYDIIFGNSSEKENKADASTALIIVGCAAMLTSIPFTVMASVNKRKANLTVTSQKTGFGVPFYVSKNIPGITLKIAIGK